MHGTSLATGAARPMWVVFGDKGLSAAERDRAIAGLERTADPRAVERRRARRTAPGLFDSRDLPVNDTYIAAVLQTGAAPRSESRWLNAISVNATPAQLRRIRGLPCVAHTEPVRAGRRSPGVDPCAIDGSERLLAPGGDAFTPRGGFYGFAEEQLTQVTLPALHDRGFAGQGVIVGILDTGFRTTHVAFNHPGHELTVVAERDFINDDEETDYEPGDADNQHQHGTYILGVLGAYKPGEMMGGAYEASFILCKTEDVTSETPVEEDYYVEGLEFIEARGGDVATSSLSYFDWYTSDDYDGLTCTTTIAVNIATANGLHCCTAAGNGGHDEDPATNHLGAPADAFEVITCGAVSSEGSITGFSSDGPSADGRVKPELLARGAHTITVRAFEDVDYTNVSGTSLSTPVVACAVACLAGARPGDTAAQMRAALFRTATDFVANGTHDPLFVRGYGIVDADRAYTGSCRADFDGDLFVTGSDFDAYVAAFEAGSEAADFDGDGFVTGLDFDAFVLAFEEGC